MKNCGGLLILQWDNSDKNYDIQVQKWKSNTKNTVQTQTHFTYRFCLTHPFLVLCSLSTYSVLTNLHILLFPFYSLPLVAGWWLPYPYRSFSYCGEFHFFKALSEMPNFYDVTVPRTRDIRRPEPNFAGHRSIKPGWIGSVLVSKVLNFEWKIYEHR